MQTVFPKHRLTFDDGLLLLPAIFASMLVLSIVAEVAVAIVWDVNGTVVPFVSSDDTVVVVEIVDVVVN